MNQLLLQKIFHHAKIHPNKTALKFFEGNYQTSQELTYKQLEEKIVALANILFSLHVDDIHKKNEQHPILLLFDSSLDYIVSFLAVLHTNNIAVTAYPPRQTRHLQRLLKIVEDSHVGTILTMAKVKKYCEINDFIFPAQAKLLCLDELEYENASRFTLLDPNPEHVAFLQYTSGSTGAPKGVVVTQKNIVSNLQLAIDLVGLESLQTCVSWLPIFHDMGLIGNTLLPLYSGGTCVFMAPLTFLKKPWFWLQKISEEKGTYTMAPNFSYELAVTALEKQKVKSELDFSHVYHLINGAEPIKPETIRHVEEVLTPYGLKPGTMKPGYGMAESTLVISVYIDKGKDRFLRVNKDKLALGQVVPETHNSVEVIRCGKILNEYTLKIVDPNTKEILPKLCVGEIWMQGASVAKGYYLNNEKTTEIFTAFTTNGEGPFLRTGDLAFIDEENYIVICGRVKDLMIINGRNIYPQDVEKACYTSDPDLIVDGSAAFSLPGEYSEECIIIAEVRNHLESERYQEILAKVKQSVFESTDVVPKDIVLIPPKRLLKTSSGKVQRNACKQAYLNKEFQVTAQLLEPVEVQSPEITATMDSGDIVNWLKNWLVTNAKVACHNIDEHRAFSEYGLNSIKLVTMISDLEQHIQQHLDPLLAWEFPNIHALSQKVANHSPIALACQSQQVYEPIAIIGMDCRIPGNDQTTLVGVEDFWAFLQSQNDSIRPIPQDRWDIRQYYDPDPVKKGMMYTTSGSFLTDVRRFDAKFFNISPREAEYLDPQQRLALMVTWNALEDAGIVPQSLKESKTGIYLGISTHDYDALIQKQVPLEELTTYQATGTSFSTAAGRIAYFLGTHGPSMAIDTACSSSLVSIHQASRALQDGDCTLAIAGGVNLILSPEGNIIFCKSGMLSPKNRCSTFDIEADGYVRGEGCGIVILKKLTDALRDHNKIYAIIHGSSVNQDGASNGLTAPNLGAQIEVMESAIKVAGLTPEQITHVEAHGTGTSLGDPIEWEGIRRVYAKDRQNPLHITSLKTRVGHLEAAAGVASFIKTVLAIKHGQIPAHLHLKQFNPKISQQEMMNVPSQLLNWDDKRRYAGVSSFGFSGTNAHFILGNFDEKTTVEKEQPRSHHLWAVSARDEKTLKTYLQKYCEFSQSTADEDFASLSHQSLISRTHFQHRAYIVAKNYQEWQQALSEGNWQQGLVEENINFAWLFTGQGCLEPNFAVSLYSSLPEFAATIDECCRITEALLDYSLRDVLLNTPLDIDINYTLYAQPALFSFEYALAKWFLSLGLKPSALLGHSLGEYVAACVAEIMSLEEALQLVCLRAKLIASLPDNGAMLAIATTAEEVQKILVNFSDLTISVKNSPQQTVVSGEKETIEALLNYCQQQGVRCKKVATSHAFHSPLMAPIVEKFYQHAQKIDYKPAKIPLITNVTGMELTNNINAEYWCEHLIKTVEFHKGLQTLATKGVTLLQEIGPKAVLSAQAQEVYNFIILPSVRDAKEPWSTLCEALGELYLKGIEINWQLLNTEIVKKHSLPKYPFIGRDYWLPVISQEEKQTNSHSWKKNLHSLKWKKLNYQPAKGDYRNEQLTFINYTDSQNDSLLSTLKNFYGKIDFITLNALTKQEILQKINDAKRLIYFCNSTDNDVNDIEEELNNVSLITKLLLEHAIEKPFVFLTHHPKNSVSKIGCALLALLKSIKQEYPVWRVHYLQGDLLNNDFQWIHSLHHSMHGHWVLRYENQNYYRRQIVPLEPHLLAGKREIYPEHTYLVTGANGGVGQLLIEALLEQGVKHIVAVGRKANPSNWSETIDAYLKKGEAHIHYHSCNVGQISEVNKLLAMVSQKLPPLGVIIHAAGVAIDKPWLTTREEEIRAIFSGKALGALNLHLATANHPIKEFVCISSIAGIFGNQGQAAYAAANAFLDALSYQRKKEGKPSLNLILGPVKNTGLFKENEENLADYLALQGIVPIEPEYIKLLLKEQEKENNIVIAQFNRKIDSLEHRDNPALDSTENSEDANKNQSHSLVENILKIVQETLKLSTGELAANDNWFEVGMDSIMAAQVVHKVNKKYKKNLISAKDIFNYSTAEELAKIVDSSVNSTVASIEKNVQPVIVKAEPAPESVPLSLQQQEIWNFLKNANDHRAYQIPMELSIKGFLRVDDFKKSVEKIGLRHDVFQYGFHEVIGQVNQHRHNEIVIKLELSSSCDEKEISDYLSEPFDLKKPPLLRTKLIKVDENEYRWLLVFHHLIADGNTVSAFINEVIADYEGQTLEEPKQYYQFITWQWNNVYYELDTNLRDYWADTLKEIPLDVPINETRKEVDVISSTLPVGNLKSAIKLIEKNKLSLSNYLLANLFEMLFEQFKREEQGIVVFFSGRENGDFSSVFGDTSNDVIITARKERNIMKQTKLLQDQLLSVIDKQYLRMAMIKEMGLQAPMISFDFQRRSDLDLVNTSLDITAVKSGNVQNYSWGDEPRILSFKVLFSRDEIKFSLKYRTDKVSGNYAEELLNKWISTISKRNLDLNNNLVETMHKSIQQEASFLQQNLWESFKNHPDGMPFYVPIFKEVDADIDVERLNLAMHSCIVKNPALRTYFSVNHQLKLTLEKEAVTVPLQVIQTNELYKTLGDLLSEPISIDKPPLFRWYLINYSHGLPILLIRLHHIIFDGISSELLLNDLVDFYNEPQKTIEQSQDSEYLKFYASAQQNYQTYLKDYQSYLLRLNKTYGIKNFTAPKKSYLGGLIYRKLSKENSIKIEHFCHKNKISKYVFYLYIFSLVIAEVLNKKNEVYISVVKSNRGELKDAGMMGYYADNVPVVIPIESESDFITQIHKLQLMILEVVQRFQYAPLTKDLSQIGYIQPEFIFNQYTLSPDKKPFYSGDYIIENIVNQQKQVSLWNYSNPEKLNFMVRTSEQGDLLALIFNQDLIEMKDVDYFLNQLIEEVMIKAQLGNKLAVDFNDHYPKSES